MYLPPRCTNRKVERPRIIMTEVFFKEWALKFAGSLDEKFKSMIKKMAALVPQFKMMVRFWKVLPTHLTNLLHFFITNVLTALRCTNRVERPLIIMTEVFFKEWVLKFAGSLDEKFKSMITKWQLLVP
ncbi:hypothetical protein AVEN_61162-1 [Araneus ventricosus]|uniref:Uncharacterized protein n=1 Tax=Araneus ventricosus TaxID=182803 RepID=A0A4Y2UYW4_ARAVE|nr:hypothetical protein AVEN_61162-1 [Araneus ventricosus]